MAVPAHYRLIFSGHTAGTVGPVEEWSWAVKGSSRPTAGNTTDPLSLKAAADAGKAAYGAHLAGLFPSWVVLSRVRCSGHVEGGLTMTNASGAYMQHDVTGNLPGTGNGPVAYPLQTALVVSLISQRSGATGKGRVYLPPPALGLDGNFLLPQPGVSNVASKFGSFLVALRQEFGLVDIVSSKGYASTVRTVKVGRVLDTQRSRRGGLAEEHQGVVLPA